MKFLRFFVQILAICFTVLEAPRIIARPPIILPPLPTPPVVVTDEPTPTPAAVDPRPSVTFSFADATHVTTRSTEGRFRPVGLHLNEVVAVTVQFPSQWANTPLTLQALDGGNISGQASNAVVTADGTVSFHFQTGSKPGLYRVFMIGAGGNSILSFWVADPTNPQINRTVVNPAH